MNAVEIEQAITDLAQQPFDAQEFPFEFLRSFGNKETTIKRLRTGNTNRSDVGGVLQRNNIHIAVAEAGKTTEKLQELRDSPATSRAKAKFILATDGEILEAENLDNEETIACEYQNFPDYFGFFLSLAGISTVKQIRDSAFDIRATSRLNRLYVELVKNNPEWGMTAKSHEMNHFMARLIFCFFAEDTGIFNGDNAFTSTLQTMTENDGSNTASVMETLFLAMNTEPAKREEANIPRWADVFPYVNGGLFSGSLEVPVFNRTARSYLLHIGALDWTQVNPDIFGSMIQAVADEEERDALGMHYTSVPNILKVLNPLFLDELNEQLEQAKDSPIKLLNLRKRIAKIRVFDPACGSGNFLVIAYKELRKIENTINELRGEKGRKSEIPITNFRGIELRDFAAEIARLALIIAEYQCNEDYLGQREALQVFLPLSKQNWITQGNALRLDWLSICPPTGAGVELVAEDLFETPLEQAEIDFENEGGETYICGNPPYLGSTWQSKAQKADLQAIFEKRAKNWKSLDYVAGWFMKAADYCIHTQASAAFVATNSICQGQQVAILWPPIFATGCQIEFAHTSFKWTNLASYNAGVTVVIVGISAQPRTPRRLFSLDEHNKTVEKRCEQINAYLVAGENVIVQRTAQPLSDRGVMSFGNKPVDGGNLLLTQSDLEALELTAEQQSRFIRRIYGSAEFIRGLVRYCLWIEDNHLKEALTIPVIAARIEAVKAMRLASRDKGANAMAERAHQMREMNFGSSQTITIGAISSENREYLPCGLLSANDVVTNKMYALYDAPLWNMAIIASRLHWVWIGTVCVRLEMRFSYSNTLGWNTFPIPQLTQKNKDDLTRSAENILLAREAHFPATIAELYDSEKMPENLRRAHNENDEIIERIYIGRRFRNDTERLEKLFDMYAKMTA